MIQEKEITCLFLDVGGVLLSNGWGHESRQLAAKYFHLDHNEFNYRHKLNMATYEEGKITIYEYLKRVVFYEKRSFSPEVFINFMFSQTTSNNDVIDLLCQLKKKYQLKILVVSNEAKELNEYRINTFHLKKLVDFFVSSCYIHFRKPDEEIFKVALDMSQTPAEQIVYIDDLSMFVEVASGLGIRGIQHKSYLSTCIELRTFGLTIDN